MRLQFLAYFLLMTTAVYAQVDSNAVVYFGLTNFEGNEKTKEEILLRELTYAEGDSVTIRDVYAHLKRSRENIFNTGLFNKVSYSISIQNKRVLPRFVVTERWYVWPYPILENGDRNFNTWWQTKDFNRLTYGVFLNWFNFRGRNETFQVLAKIGFENQFALGYNIPNLNKKKTLGIYVAGGYSEFREVNYASENNKRVFYKSENGPGRQMSYGKVYLTYRRNLNFRHQVGIEYSNLKVDSAILDLSFDYIKGNKSQTEFFTLSYLGKFDTRDYIDYPLRGMKIEWQINQYGLGLLNNENLNLTTVLGGVSWHVPLGGRWYFANRWYGKLSFNDDPPYSIQRGLGYKNSVRGYELYVMDAQRYGLVQSNLKYTLIRNLEFKLPWIPLEKFREPYMSVHLNGYVDFGYAEDELYADVNALSNALLIGYGIGLDFVSFYDFVMRIEYSRNKLNEGGVYLHFKKSI